MSAEIISDSVAARSTATENERNILLLSLVTCFVLSLPHILYYFIWMKPYLWMRSATKANLDPVQRIYHLAVVIKIVQYSAVLYWWYAILEPRQLQTALEHISPWSETPFTFWQGLGIPMFLIGQFLNFAAYGAIGINGIYYGYKLGKKIPWCYDWPFGGPWALKNPQYIGCSISIWGAFFFFCSTPHYEAGATNISIFWSLCYLFSGIIENFF